ncbi:NAC domain [Dillenia turbinata]|uniref:NAC domain n=1 Tax=Dillenia turbinata TaxID=194707 RepID=A0AAN8UKX8_9MAGN
MKSSLPPGFRFHPTDVELIVYYLKRKVFGKRLHFDLISKLDIYKSSPGDLPDFSNLKTGDLKWYSFSPREKKYANGAWIDRATETGHWKATGNDRSDSYVLSMVLKKSDPGPRNGVEYGAPFREEDWEGSEDANVELIPPLGLPAEVLGSAGNQIGSTLTCTPAAEVTQSVITSEHLEPPVPDDDILSMLNWFTEDANLVAIDNDRVENVQEGNSKRTFGS